MVYKVYLKPFFRISFAEREQNFECEHEANNFWKTICETQKEKFEKVYPVISINGYYIEITKNLITNTFCNKRGKLKV